MTTLKGPGIFLAQFAGDQPPFHDLKSICTWAQSLGFKGVQIPTNNDQFIDLQKAAESKTYADEIKGLVNDCGMEITELSTHLQGQLVAVNPAYDLLFDSFAPESLRNNPRARTEWAIQQLKYAAKASQNLGLNAHATFSGSLLWHTFHPWPQRPAGLVEEGFSELARRWTPILNEFDACGVDVCYEVHPGEDLFDGDTYEMFLEKVNNHARACLLYDPSHFVLQCLDYIEYIDIFHERIKAFHVKDSEFNP
ncbi:MAG TPA: sugar phosphate isomerase/epimerase, partial [Niabella sp.]